MAGKVISALYKRSVWIIIWVFSCAVASAQQSLRPITLTGTYTRGDLFKKIEEKTGYAVNYSGDFIDKSEKIYVNFRNAPIEEVMGVILQGEYVVWEIHRPTRGLLLNKSTEKLVYTPKDQPTPTLTGLVTDMAGEPIPGASITVNGTFKGTITGVDGHFKMEGVPDKATLVVRSVGFQPEELQLSGQRVLSFSLEPSVMFVQGVEIVATGFQNVPAERSTGSFVGLNNQMINRRQTGSIVDRLEGITSGLLSFTTQTQGLISKMPSPASLGVNLRGISSLSPNNVNPNPLIVLDNFPYEGDIKNINPNDIESITILKDAASASIWGSRSGNGVIVLTTRKGKLGQKMRMDFNTNLTISSRPDVYYDPNFMNARDFIGVEDTLFKLGYFNADINNRTSFPPLSPAVEIMKKQRNGMLTATEAAAQLNALKQYDVREDYLEYIYQPGVNQQYAVNVRGGSDNMSYYFSLGHDRARDNLVSNGGARTTLTASNTLVPLEGLEITGFVNYSYSKIYQPNELRVGAITVGGRYGTLYPYAQLADASGNALAVVKDYSAPFVDSVGALGYMDWHYRPLDEINNSENTTSLQDLVLRASVKYKFTPSLFAEVQYQNERQVISSYLLRSEGTYFARNLINRYSERDAITGTFKYNFPKGGVLSLGSYDWRTNNVRASLNFSQKFGEHAITAIAGSEIRELSAVGAERYTLGFSGETGTGTANLNFNQVYNTYPSGSGTLNDAFLMSGNVNRITNRFISYYVNAGYSFKNRYDFTISGRTDGTNLFGVETNEKIIPLWSTGLGWRISDEPFYSKENWMQELRVRASAGLNGNVYNGSAYLTGANFTDPLTGLPIINNIAPANDQLRWERVKLINFGVDFSSRKGRLSGSIEYFDKRGIDLVERNSPAPQIGYSQVLRNTASTKTTGFDITLNGKIADRKFKWNTSLLVSQIKDEITDFDAKPNAVNSLVRDPNAITLVKGRPTRAMFSYKWAGLDHQTGDPLGYLNGAKSNSYAALLNPNTFNADSLVYHGSAYPTIYGSFRNDFAFKRFSLSVNIIFKLGYYFRRPGISISYPDLIRTGMGADYNRRWQKSGDELVTDVPSITFPGSTGRTNFYQLSEVLVERADHIRLQDVRFSYDLSIAKGKRILQLYSYFNNIGILWRANKHKLDPDIIHFSGSHFLPKPFSATLGVQASF